MKTEEIQPGEANNYRVLLNKCGLEAMVHYTPDIVYSNQGPAGARSWKVLYEVKVMKVENGKQRKAYETNNLEEFRAFMKGLEFGVEAQV